MPHSHVACYLHVVFGVRDRRRRLPAAIHPRLYRYLGGIARQHGARLLAAGGVEDHVHLLLSLPGKLSISAAVRYLKGGASRWLHETVPLLAGLRWQDGYGAFSVSPSVMNRTKAYIARQAQHHRRRSFEQELREFVRLHPTEVGEDTQRRTADDA